MYYRVETPREATEYCELPPYPSNWLFLQTCRICWSKIKHTSQSSLARSKRTCHCNITGFQHLKNMSVSWSSCTLLLISSSHEMTFPCAALGNQTISTHQAIGAGTKLVASSTTVMHLFVLPGLGSKRVPIKRHQAVKIRSEKKTHWLCKAWST